ncbi:MAG: EAL domain-containing protein [Desulfovibrio sp.]
MSTERVEILIVDDERVNLVLLQGMLRDFDINIVTATSGEEAMSLVSHHDFALILLDVMMPHMNGFELAYILNSHPKTKHVPIIFITAISKDREHMFRGYKTGAVDYLIKPIESEILRSKVHVFIELYEQRRAQERIAEELKDTIDKLKSSQTALQENEERYKTVAEYAYDWESWSAPDGTFVYISPSCERITGYPPERFRQDSGFVEEIIHSNDLEKWQQYIRGGTDGSHELDYRIFHMDGKIRWVSQVKRNVYGSEGEYLGVRSSIRDITAKKALEEAMDHQALHDPLTGLANRLLLQKLIEKALERRNGTPRSSFALLFMNIDRFKVLNESLGHDFGDKFLIEVGKRLVETVQPGDTVSRFSGDEYVLLLRNLDSPRVVLQAAEKVQAHIQRPFLIDGQEVQVTCSIGIVTGPRDYDTAKDMLQNTTIALNMAKQAGRNRFFFYDPSMHERAMELMTIETDLRRAVRNGEFVVYMQPIIDLKTLRLQGFESLVRWVHPEKGMISPDSFIPLAEETGIIVDIDDFVLRESCRQYARWQEKYPTQASQIFISVNLSAHQFRTENLVWSIQDVFRDEGVSPTQFHLELTETALMADAQKTVEILELLQEVGFKVCVDDFGTGYSSLSYLQSFSLDKLKVDLSFVRNIHVSHDDRKIVKTIVDLGQSLGLEVVAEGIELEKHQELLQKMGCDYGQGYFFSKPLPVAEAEEYFYNYCEENECNWE